MTLRALLYYTPLLSVLGCGDPGAVEFPVVPEPEQPLRPEAQRGTVREDARIADYVLEARLDTESRQVTGTARLTWRNRTQRTVDTLPFHLYMNGFRSETTEWMRTSHGRHRRSDIDDEEGTWGYIDVHSVELVSASPGLDGPRFVGDAIESPPDETVPLPFREDPEPSTMTVDLPRPVGPGESITVALGFTTQLPRVLARTGYQDDFYAVAQWYPKLGVLEEDGGWQAHSFTVHDEFYADFGNYTAILDVPEEMVVGASGVRTDEVVAGGRKRLTYQAEMVHDFVWMADPDFVEHYGEYDGIRIRQLIHPERVADVDEHLAAQLAAFASYEKRYGPYPWSTITIVHPPKDGGGAGGMEYPTLYTTANRAAIPEWVRRSIFEERASGVFVTLHEFGHQYFQGLFASREHLEPWLDEGMNTFSNMLAYADWLGEDPWLVDLLGQRIYGSDMVGATLRARAFLGPVDRPARDFAFLIGNYGSTVYQRPAALMMTLRNLVGHDAFDRALRVYCDQARFRHPTGRELEATLASELGGRVRLNADGGEPVEIDVADFLEQALHTARKLDFALLEVRNRRRMGEAGWRRDDGGELTGGEPPEHLDAEIDELADEEVEGVVAVHRAGEFLVPVEIEVELGDGSVERFLWDAREPTAIFEWPGRRVRRATLDPDRKLVLEWSRLDNTAFAPDQEESDGLSAPFGALAEAFSLALSGMVGP